MRHQRIAAFTMALIGGCADPASTTVTAAQQGATADSSQSLASVLRGARRLPYHPARKLAPLGAAAAKDHLPAIDTLVHFSGQFTSPGFDDDGNPKSVWPYTMVGRDPAEHRTTRFRAPIIPITVEMLDETGAVGKTATGAPLRQVAGADTLSEVLRSPVFERFRFDNGNLQLTDGLMRAQFFHIVGDRDGDRDDRGYHNVLEPVVVTPRTIQLPFGAYRAIPKADGTCCRLVLADLREFERRLATVDADDTTTVMGAAEHAGDIRPSDITTALTRDVMLRIDPDLCCVSGFHGDDTKPGTPANGNRDRDFVFNYSTYMSEDLPLQFSQDVSVLSHEMEELFTDPFLVNRTPWRLVTDPIFLRTICLNLLELGDVVNVMFQNEIYSATAHGKTYHPQNAALLQWFESESPSSARLGAWSYPDETAVMALSPEPLLPDCVPAP
jgi:hypothetical protein